MDPRSLILLLVLALIGCGNGETERSEQALRRDGALEVPIVQASPPQTAQPLNAAHTGVSEEGRFEVRWPSGCAKLRTRRTLSKIHPDRTEAVELTCFRNGDENVGCKVTAYDETSSGGPVTPADVTATIGRTVETLGVEIWKQTPVASDGRQGVMAYCREVGGTRQLWIVGFIERGRVLIAMAWDVDDELYRDPDVIRFFQTVRSTAP